MDNPGASANDIYTMMPLTTSVNKPSVSKIAGSDKMTTIGFKIELTIETGEDKRCRRLNHWLTRPEKPHRHPDTNRIKYPPDKKYCKLSSHDYISLYHNASKRRRLPCAQCS